MSREYACTAERFAADVSKHEMTILRDDGVNRHLRFKRPSESAYWFDVLTWGGRLYIGGDCGTYVFDRLHDMFEFFRSAGSRINPHYWHEKVEASAKDGIEKFEWDTFVADVKDHFDQCFPREALPDDASDDDREADRAEFAKNSALWAEIQEQLSFAEHDEYGACAFIRDFQHDGWHFEDWERRSTEYTFRFIWNCRAIVWAIAQYDAHKAAAK